MFTEVDLESWPRRNTYEFCKRAVGWRVAKESDVRAQIGVPAVAPLALHARSSRIDGNERARG